MIDIFKKRRTIIINEEDVTKVLSAINDNIDIAYEQGIIIDECTWVDDSSKWFIVIRATNEQLNSILESVKEITFIEVQ